MRNQGVGAGRFDDYIKGSGAARPYDVGLDAAELVGGIAAFIHVVPDFTDRMKRREFVRTCIDEINPHTLAGLRLKSVAAGHVGVILEDSPIKDDVCELAVEHGLYIVGILEQLRLDQDVFPVCFGPGLRILRVHDDGAKHPASYMLDHRRCATVIEKDAGLLGHEGITDGFIRGIDPPMNLYEVDLRGAG